MRTLSLTRLCFALATHACSGGSERSEPEPLGALASPLASNQYVDARSYFTEEDDINGWYALTSALKANFDDVCGDTFCEGDYSNYESLGLRCSVEQSSGAIGGCVWIFAASTDEINPATGDVEVHGQIWRCPLPIAPSTSARDLLGALTGVDEQPLHAPLPASEQSLYDGLVDCL